MEKGKFKQKTALLPFQNQDSDKLSVIRTNTGLLQATYLLNTWQQVTEAEMEVDYDRLFITPRLTGP